MVFYKNCKTCFCKTWKVWMVQIILLMNKLTIAKILVKTVSEACCCQHRLIFEKMYFQKRWKQNKKIHHHEIMRNVFKSCINFGKHVFTLIKISKKSKEYFSWINRQILANNRKHHWILKTDFVKRRFYKNEKIHSVKNLQTSDLLRWPFFLRNNCKTCFHTHLKF